MYPTIPDHLVSESLLFGGGARKDHEQARTLALYEYELTCTCGWTNAGTGTADEIRAIGTLHVIANTP